MTTVTKVMSNNKTYFVYSWWNLSFL